MSLEDAVAAGDAIGWAPQEGDLLIGTVIGLSKGWSDYKQGFYPIITVQPDFDRCDPNNPNIKDGSLDSGFPLAVHGFQFVLEDRFTALKPAVGEVLGIKVGPKVPTKDGKRTVATYTVKVDGRSEDIWSDIKGPRQTAPVQTAPNVDIQAAQDSEDIPF